MSLEARFTALENSITKPVEELLDYLRGVQQATTTKFVSPEGSLEMGSPDANESRDSAGITHLGVQIASLFDARMTRLERRSQDAFESFGSKLEDWHHQQ